MNDELQISALQTDEGQQAVQGSPPIAVNERGEYIDWADLPANAYPKIVTPRGLMVNSALRKDEWERLDQAVVEAAKQRLVGVGDLIQRELTQPLGSLGVLTSQWNVSSLMTAPTVSMSGASAGDQDRVDFNLKSTPVPVIHKVYQIGARQLAADRLAGNAVDTTNAMEASFVVSEKIEDMLFNGVSNFQFNGDSIFGYTTETNVNSDTASNFGGGDWGTAGNPEDTVAGMINTLGGTDKYYGPYGVYVAPTQYYEAANNFNTDGSGDTGLDRIMRLSGVEFVHIAPALSDGEVVVVQLTRNVIDIAGIEIDSAEAMVQNVEWTSPDGMTSYFKVFAVVTPRPKSDYDGNSGIAYATGA